MDEIDLCVCCLRCPPDKDLTTPYTHHDETEIYSDMLQDCFNIQMVLDGCGSCGICSSCAGRLRDASEFKLQVQRCQAELSARTPARSRVKEEELDTELPEDHEEGTGYERVLKELLGPGLTDGDGASDDEEATVKQEMITIDEGELYAEPAVRSEVPAAAASDEERPQHEEPDRELPAGHEEGTGYERVLQELPGPGLADGAGASDDEESPVKLEMIPADEAELFGAESAVSLRARRQLAAACAVRLERLRAPPAPARRASARHTYACDMCTQRFNSKSVLIRHIGSHYRCEVCDKTFMMSACLTRHERNCTEDKQRERKLANKNTLSKSHGEVVLYYCDECGKRYKFKTFLSKHIQRSHTVRQVLNNSHSILFKHQVRLTQKKPFHCSQCVFKGRTKSGLQRHQIVHTGEKPFKCDFCDFKSNQKSNLQTHQRTHTGEKPFKCGICDFKCSDKSNFRMHIRIHTGEKPLKCDYCVFRCSDKSNFRRHKRIHTGEKPFKCAICDYACSRKETLQSHLRIHTGEKPFKCGICDYTCSKKTYLRRHEMVHR